nr:hypothetical protein Ade03nite_20780 [Actinoplanes derwentensis]
MPTITGFPFDGKFEISPTNLRTGPGMECPSFGMGFATDAVRYYCWRMNERGESWTFIGIPAAQMFGWVYGGTLVGGGSPTACPSGQPGPGGGYPPVGNPVGGGDPSGTQVPIGSGGNTLTNSAVTGHYGPGATTGTTGGSGGANPLADPAVTGHYGPGTTTGTTGGTPNRNGIGPRQS